MPNLYPCTCLSNHFRSIQKLCIARRFVLSKRGLFYHQWPTHSISRIDSPCHQIQELLASSLQEFSWVAIFTPKILWKNLRPNFQCYWIYLFHPELPRKSLCSSQTTARKKGGRSNLDCRLFLSLLVFSASRSGVPSSERNSERSWMCIPERCHARIRKFACLLGQGTCYWSSG